MSRRRALTLALGVVGQLVAVTSCRPLAAGSDPTRDPVSVSVQVLPTEPTPSPVPSPTPSPLPPSATPSATPLPSPTATFVPTPTSTPMATPTSPPEPTLPPGEPAPVIVRGEPSTNVVALTFDAGSNSAEGTPKILDTLKDHQVKATMFVTGEWVEVFPDLLRRMVDDGHEIANHTYNHPDLTKLSDDEVASQMSRTEDAVQRIVGVTTKPYMRPPFGAYDERVLRILGADGYVVIFWSLDSGDWRTETTSADVQQRVAEETKAGDIVVFHAYPMKTADALPQILRRLRERGLTPGSVAAALQSS